MCGFRTTCTPKRIASASTVLGGRPGVCGNTVVKNKQTHWTFDGVIAVCHSVHDCLAQGGLGQLGVCLGLKTLNRMWDFEMQAQEACGVIDDREQLSGQVLAVKRVVGNVSAGDTGRIDLRKGQLPLRITTEQHNAGEGWVFSKYEPPAPQEPLPVHIQIRLLRFFEKALNGVHI